MAAYLRKISIDGYVVRLDLPELRENGFHWLRRSSNNLNQIAKRVNETSRIYDADIDCLQGEPGKNLVGGEWDSDTACEYKVIGILAKNPWV